MKTLCDPESGPHKSGLSAAIEQIGAQLLFEPAKRPALEVLEHDRAQQTVGRDSGAPKIYGALAPSRQRPRGNGHQGTIIEQQINLASGGSFRETSSLKKAKPKREGWR